VGEALEFHPAGGAVLFLGVAAHGVKVAAEWGKRNEFRASPPDLGGYEL